MASTEETLSTETAGIKELIKSLDVTDENVNAAVREGLKEGARIILNEQKRIISARSSVLPTLIKMSDIKVSKKNTPYINIGYDADAVKQHPEGVVLEFGRPGKSGKTEMEQTRHKKDGSSKKYKVKIGKISEYSHIRRGFDNKVEQAIQATIDTVNAVIERGISE